MLNLELNLTVTFSQFLQQIDGILVQLFWMYNI
jgi:hypothetical protein